jgi:single-strand DNA-binding protein
MSNLNVVVLQGNLVADPEIVGKEQNVARFTIAVNNGFGDNKETAFVDCVAFGKQVETIKEYFAKGKQVLIRGGIRQNRWETKEGEKRSKLEVVLDNFAGFSFVGGGKPSDKEGAPATAEATAGTSSGEGKLF